MLPQRDNIWKCRITLVTVKTHHAQVLLQLRWHLSFPFLVLPQRDNIWKCRITLVTIKTHRAQVLLQLRWHLLLPCLSSLYFYSYFMFRNTKNELTISPVTWVHFTYPAIVATLTVPVWRFHSDVMKGCILLAVGSKIDFILQEQ